MGHQALEDFSWHGFLTTPSTHQTSKYEPIVAALATWTWWIFIFFSNFPSPYGLECQLKMDIEYTCIL